MNPKTILFLVMLGASFGGNFFAQGVSLPEGKKEMALDSMTKMEMPVYKNKVSVGAKYLFNPLSNTIPLFSSSGFSLDEQAIEYQLRIYNLPKVYYYQQLGSLTESGNYVSVTGFGLKEDIRFDIVKSKNFILTPYFELGGGYFRANVIRGITNNSVTTVLGNTVSQSAMDNFVVSGDVGLDLGVAFSLDQTRVALVCSGGYLSNFPSPWRVAGSLAFKERMNLSSPYVGITIKIELKEDSCCAGCCEPMKN
jgi:hypothetical protein